jgi:signal peptidase I
MVDGPSMEPNFYPGEIFMVNENVQLNDYKRGDVIVFFNDDNPQHFYIKRIIGLPGERLQIKNDGIFIDNGSGYKKLKENYLSEQAVTALPSESYRSGYTHTYIVPAGKFFVLGDNRGHSLDSRYFKDPFISTKNIKGRYLFNIAKL